MTSKKNITYLSIAEDKFTKKNIDLLPKYCGNCGSQYHNYNNCTQPLTSYGLICFRPKKKKCQNINNDNYNNNIGNKNSNSGNSNSNSGNNNGGNNFKNINIDYNNNFEILKDNEFSKIDYEILLVQRKFTIGYIEFLRGKYQTTNFKYLNKIIDIMIDDEKKNILEKNDFDILRDELGMNKRNKLYINEYEESKKKFNYLKKNKLLEGLFKVNNNWKETEWGIPKGRRNNYENNMECAIREFLEETGIKSNDLIVYKNVIPLEEIYTGINNMKYKHVYYFATIKNDEKYMDNLQVDITNYEQFSEIRKINWFNLKNSIEVIRSYYYSKINTIKKAFQIINNLGIYFDC